MGACELALFLFSWSAYGWSFSLSDAVRLVPCRFQ